MDFVDLTQDPPLIKVYASKTARQSGEPSRVVPILFPVLERLLIRAIGESAPPDPYCGPVKRSAGTKRRSPNIEGYPHTGRPRR